MADPDPAQPAGRRPSLFWWTLVNVLAACFAIAAWSLCLYLFNFPERPWNYHMLRRLDRLPPVKPFPPIESPEGQGADPRALLSLFWSMDDEQVAARNIHFRQNYLTNYRKPEVVRYVEGQFRVSRARPLTPDDFFHPGLVVDARAVIRAPGRTEPTPYPLTLEILLPAAEPLPAGLFPPGRLLTLEKVRHRACILHAAKIGTPNEPLVCLTIVPLAYDHWQDPDGRPLPLTPPDPVRPDALFPVLEHNRKP